MNANQTGIPSIPESDSQANYVPENLSPESNVALTPEIPVAPEVAANSSDNIASIPAAPQAPAELTQPVADITELESPVQSPAILSERDAFTKVQEVFNRDPKSLTELARMANDINPGESV